MTRLSMTLALLASALVSAAAGSAGESANDTRTEAALPPPRATFGSAPKAASFASGWCSDP